MKAERFVLVFFMRRLAYEVLLLTGRMKVSHSLTFAGKKCKNTLNPSVHAGWRVFCYVIFSWGIFYFLVSAKIFLISPSVLILLLKSMPEASPMSLSTSS